MNKETIIFRGKELLENKEFQEKVVNKKVISYISHFGDRVNLSSDSNNYYLEDPSTFWKNETAESDDNWYITNGLVPIEVYNKMQITIEL